MTRLPVLFLPGTLCTGAVFGHQIETLAAVAGDVHFLQFLHESSIDEMADLAAQWIPADTGAAVVGFSMGGMVAMALARRYPELTAKIALLNTNSHAELPERNAARMKHLAAARRDGIGAVVASQYVPRYLHRQQPGHRELIIGMAERLGVDCFEAQLDALATRPDASSSLPAIRAPTLVLGSTGDELCPPEQQIHMHRMIPGSDLVLLGSCGHFSPLERPRAVSSALLDWYQSSAESR